MAAARTLDFRDLQPARGAHVIVHHHVAHLDVDRPLYTDHDKMKALVKSMDLTMLLCQNKPIPDALRLRE